MRNRQGLLNLGLWDYVPIRFKQPMVPVIVSDTLVSMDLCQKCVLLFAAVENTEAQAQAQELFSQLRTAARAALLESDGITVVGRCQSAQALGIAYGLFDPGEKKGAVDVLLSYIQKSDNHLDTGILGERVIFDVLADHGYVELAYDMITRPDYPSFGHWILSEDCTSMFESFKTPQEPPCSKNHHWHGHITAWFFKYLAGIRINPHDRDIHEIDISPNFISTLEHAEAHHMLPYGKVSAAWKRTGSNIVLAVTLPEGCYGMLRLPEGWVLPCENYSYTAHTLAPGSTEYLLYPN
jgi:alpha-L-rhamnosidase